MIFFKIQLSVFKKDYIGICSKLWLVNERLYTCSVVCKKSLKMPKCLSESVNRRRTDNAVTKLKKTKGKTTQWPNRKDKSTNNAVTKQKGQKNRQRSHQTERTKRQTTQSPNRKDKRTDNAVTKQKGQKYKQRSDQTERTKGQTTQWPNRKDKRTDNDLQNNTQKTKHHAIRTPLKK